MVKFSLIIIVSGINSWLLAARPFLTSQKKLTFTEFKYTIIYKCAAKDNVVNQINLLINSRSKNMTHWQRRIEPLQPVNLGFQCISFVYLPFCTLRLSVRTCESERTWSCRSCRSRCGPGTGRAWRALAAWPTCRRSTCEQAPVRWETVESLQ